MRRLTHLRRVGGQLVGYSVTHREWWLLVLIAVLVLAAALISAGHVVAPYTIYTVF